jgi:hypothetical protein
MSGKVNWLIVFCLLACTRQHRPVEIECPDPEPVICPSCPEAPREVGGVYEAQANLLLRCEAEKSLMKQERSNLESEIEHLNDDVNYWRDRYMETPSCNYQQDEND